VPHPALFFSWSCPLQSVAQSAILLCMLLVKHFAVLHCAMAFLYALVNVSIPSLEVVVQGSINHGTAVNKEP